MRRALIAAGALTMAYALIGAVTDSDVDHLGVLAFLLAVLLLHDAVFLPLLLAAGALIRRVIPSGWQATVRTAAAVDLAVVVVALPLVLGFGRSPGNPSVLPRPYAAGLLLTLAVCTGTVLACRKKIERSPGGRRRRPSE
ncbi:hypothetical protein OHA21_13030 [Actinoplanes sp. NBC_00393]|uniref:hypothetical protein n=1 Tax=Actinoplanes sp. NBC_00393 TaxID=2975953 RepID=UPI002E1F5C22